MFSRASLSCIIEILCQVTTNSPFFYPHDVVTQATSSWSGFSSKDKTYFNCPRFCPLPPCSGIETFSGQKRSKMSWHDCLPQCWQRRTWNSGRANYNTTYVHIQTSLAGREKLLSPPKMIVISGNPTNQVMKGRRSPLRGVFSVQSWRWPLGDNQK